MDARAALFIPLAFTLVGCPPLQRLTLYNNSGRDVTIVAKDREIVWQSASSIEIKRDGPLRPDELEWVSTEAGSSPTLLLEFTDSMARYVIRSRLPGPYVDQSTGEVRRRMQLQPDRKLYAVRSDASLPTDALLPQPEGFPLQPTEEHVPRK